jgi:hypothetical protein
LPGFPLWKFVDLNSSFKGLLGDRLIPSWALLLVFAIPVLIFLTRVWFRLNQLGESQRKLIWAATLTWTLVINLYVGVYDSALAILGVWLTADVLLARQEKPGRGLPMAFRLCLVALYVAPWVSQPLARMIGFQLYTLVLAGLGAFQLFLAHDRFSIPVEAQA